MIFKKKLIASLSLALLLGFSSSALANISLSIKDGDIKDVLSAISTISGKSIVTDDSVKGTISIDLNDVPFDTALDIVTRAKGLSYKTMNNVVVVSTADNMEKFFGRVTVFKLQYATAKEVVEALKGTFSKGLSFDPVTNSIIFSGSIGDENKLRDALKTLDVATKQITLEAKIIAVDLEDAKNLGVTWNWTELPEAEESNSDTTYGGIMHLGHGYTARFQATLNALYTNKKANILATPRIITIPGKQASIFIGDHIPVTTEKVSNGSTTTTTEYVDAGIKLSYTPVVSEDGYITAAVHTEVSTASLVSELKNYKITSRTADTNVRMRNGETLIIGGLINEEEQKNLQKVPFLSNIPILGELFKNRTTSKVKTEVMMILTPYITDAGDSPAIYDPRTKNTTFSPVPGSYEDTENKALRKEEDRLADAKRDAIVTPPKVATTTRIIKSSDVQIPEVSGKKLTMRQRADQLLAAQKAKNAN